MKDEIFIFVRFRVRYYEYNLHTKTEMRLHQGIKALFNRLDIGEREDLAISRGEEGEIETLVHPGDDSFLRNRVPEVYRGFLPPCRFY